jgi:hypothetical protein
MLSNTSDLNGVVTFVVGIINIIIPVLTVLALALFLYSGVRLVLNASEAHGRGAARDAMMWGIISLFVLVSVWGILRIMCTTLFGSPTCNNTATSSTSAPSNGQHVLLTIPSH